MRDSTKEGGRGTWRGWLLWCWAYLESIIWFIAADYLLFLFALDSDDNAWHLWLVTTASLLGIVTHAILFLLFPVWTEAVLRSTPFVQAWMFETVASMLDTSVWLAVVQPWTLIAVKVWTYTAVTGEVSLGFFVPLVILGRVTRWIAVLGVARLIRWYEPRTSSEWYWHVMVAWSILFATVMVLGEL